MLKKFFAVGFLIFSSACSSLGGKTAQPVPLPEPSLEKIADNVWIHKSYAMAGSWGLVLSQGLVVDTGAGVALVDTAWTDKETQTLLDLIEREIGALPDIAIITHAHADKMGRRAACAKPCSPFSAQATGMNCSARKTKTG